MNRNSSLLRSLYLACIGTLLTVALATDGRTAPASKTGSGPQILRVGLSDSLRNHADPLVRYLEKETGLKIEITFTPGLPALVNAMVKNEIDLAPLGGAEYAQVWGRAGAKPLVQREGDATWHTVFITQPQLKINSLKDLNGHTFAFGGAMSNSSRVMPEYWMIEAKVDRKVIDGAIARMNSRPPTNHDNLHRGVVLAVANKEVDAGSLDRRFLEDMIKNGEITDQQVRIFWEPPSFPDSTWAVRKDFDPKLADSVANAFLKLDAQNPEHKVILDLLGAKGPPFGSKFVRSSNSAFDVVRKAVRADGLME